LSPLYKVRDFKVEDSSPFAINVGWMGSSADAEAAKGAEEDGDTQMTGGEGEAKTATVFPAESRTDTLKMLTFFRKGPFNLKVEYPEETSKLLLPMTARELGSYQIDLAAQAEPQKVKVRAKHTL